MPEALVIPAGGGEVVGDTADRRVEILSEDDSLHATWSRFGPRREGAELHVHRHHTDLFYVLAGELTARLGLEDEAVAVPAGSLVRLPPLVVHGFRNGSDAELRYLNLHAPGKGFADYLRGRNPGFDQHDPPAEGVRPVELAEIGRGEEVAGGVRLLADEEEIGISEALLEPGSPAPPAHVHREHVESFYVLEGELTLVLDGGELRAEAGTWAQVPAGVPHTFAVAGDRPARFLDLHTPGRGYGAFLRGLHAARSDDELAAVRAAFDQSPA